MNAYLVALFAITWWASTRDRPWVAGSAAALATAFKLSPIVLLWWFLTQKWWRTSRAFVVALVALGGAGLVFAGLQANLDFLHLAVGGGVEPTPLSLPALLHRFLKLGSTASGFGTVAAVIAGMVAVVALRHHPRAAFTAAILTTIYSSPVVLEGNFALLVAVASPWVLPPRVPPTEQVAADGATTHVGPVEGTTGHHPSGRATAMARAAPVEAPLPATGGRLGRTPYADQSTIPRASGTPAKGIGAV